MEKQNPLEWSKNLTMYEVNLRQYSEKGDFKSFEDDLPRLKKLGVGIIWFMPIFPVGKKNRKGKLGSQYSVRNYHKIYSGYGTLAAFKRLVKKIHKEGMYVLMDWVANHTAWDHHWTKEKPEFYVKDEDGNIVSPNQDWTDVAKLDFENRDLWEAMADEMLYWIKNTGIDGFRCDMAHLVPTEFWNFIREKLDEEKKVLMLAESENRDLLEKAFDMEYNWNLHHLFNAIAKNEKCVWDIDHALQNEIYDFPTEKSQLLFTSNHDENSWQGAAVQRLGLGLEPLNVLAFTMDGMPLIYNGQEAGLYKKLSFFEKDPIPWQEDKMFAFYQKLIQLRKKNPALWSGVYGGKLQRVYTEVGHAIFAFVRKKEGEKVVVITNLSHDYHEFTLQGDAYNGIFTDVFAETEIALHENFRMGLQPWEYKVYSTK
ncbi:MAG: alpha-amylase [Bacteroidia bacterium]|nr:MAG: alpha-amylase [Bacteroidia bacterium]